MAKITYADKVPKRERLSSYNNDEFTLADANEVKQSINAIYDLNQNGYKNACILGDSITGQHSYLVGGAPIQGSQGFWNWANWMCGSPFHFNQNLGISGDFSENIFSRIWQIQPNVDSVFILAGTNDIFSFNSSATALQISTEIAKIKSAFTAGLMQLKSAGKKVCIATVPPNNGFSSSSDARIQVLDAINAFIKTLKTTGDVYEVVDLFSAYWDSTAPTTRVFKAGFSTDGTHLTNRAGLDGGLVAISAMKAMYLDGKYLSTKLDDRQNMLSQIGQMRTISGITSTISYGTGTLASGWRSLSQGVGTPTVLLDNTIPYTISTNYVGPMTTMVSAGEKWQKVTITDAIASGGIRLQLSSSLANVSGISPGDEFSIAIDVWVESQTNLEMVSIQGVAAFTPGTSPTDQPYTVSSGQARTTSGQNSVSGVNYALSSPFRAHLISERVRIPENINSTVAISANVYIDVVFKDVGQGVFYFGRPQFWRKIY